MEMSTFHGGEDAYHFCTHTSRTCSPLLETRLLSCPSAIHPNPNRCRFAGRVSGFTNMSLRISTMDDFSLLSTSPSSPSTPTVITSRLRRIPCELLQKQNRANHAFYASTPSTERPYLALWTASFVSMPLQPLRWNTETRQLDCDQRGFVSFRVITV